MANNKIVEFQRGLQEVYDRTYWQDNVFYYTTDTKNFYLGNIKLSNGADLAAAIERISSVEQGLGALEEAFKGMWDTLMGDESVDNSVKSIVKEYIDIVNADMGNVDDLSTTNKTVVGAINEVLAAVGTGGTAAVVTLEETTSSDYAKVYTLKQGSTLVGNINIPKDMVVKSGAVEVNPEGQEEGTYIVLTLANATEDKIYVNVGTLVDIYTAKGEAAQVQIAIDSASREISASIVAGSITSTELADNSVITAKIADENVTLAKLSKSVQESLANADSAMQQTNLDNLKTEVETDIATAKAEAIADAEGKIATAKTEAAADATAKANKALEDAKAYTEEKAGEGLQASDFTTGETNGTFKVKDTEVAIAGLGSAAYAETEDFDAAGSADAALASAKTYSDANLQAAKLYSDANLQAAKDYTYGLMTWGDIFENLN